MKKIIVKKEDYLSTFKNYKLGLHSFEKYDKWFPISSSPELAGIIGDITADGHLGKGLVQFISKDKNNAIRFNNEVFRIFKISGKIKVSPSNKKIWECLICRNAFCRILNLCGAPGGDKVLKVFYVPEWIIGGSKEIKKRYLQRLFDCEGSVVLQKNRQRVHVIFKMYKATSLVKNHLIFLNQLRCILSGFKIKTTNPSTSGYTERKDGIITVGYEFRLYGTRKNLDSVLNFKKSISFESLVKKEKLEKYLNIVKNADTSLKKKSS